jgi:hypothetical protein
LTCRHDLDVRLGRLYPFEEEKKESRLSQTISNKRYAYAHSAQRVFYAHSESCAPQFQAPLVSYSHLAHWDDPRPGKHTVTAVVRVMGSGSEKHFQNYHRMLNRATWSSLEVSSELLGLLLSTLAATGAMSFSLDDTIERRVGKQIKAKGIYREPVRSSHRHFESQWVALA